MNGRKYLNIVNVITFMLFKDVALGLACKDDEKTQECEKNEKVEKVEICYGGLSGITAADVLCIMNNDCDDTYRIDACDKCEKNPSLYEYGSQYKDCTEKCYETDKMSEMKKVDKCGVCDGTDSTCNPSVTRLDITVIPSNTNISVNITGQAMMTANIQILLLKVVTTQSKREAPNDIEYQHTENDNAGYDHRIVKRATEKTVLRTLNIVKVYTDTSAEIRLDDIEAGAYEIGARTGEKGDEYKAHNGPPLFVYNENDFKVPSISPTEQDLDGTDKIKLSLQLKKTSGHYGGFVHILKIAQSFTCFYSPASAVIVSEALSSAVGTYTSTDRTLECEIDVPDVSKAVWVCPSFNKIHLLQCQRIAFYLLAPKPVGNDLTFTDSGRRLYVDFDTAVESSVNAPCSSYFTDVSTLGVEPKCYFNVDGDQLSILLGDSSTANPGETLELKAGLKAREGEFRRESVAVTLTLLVTSSPPSSSGDEIEKIEKIEIAKVGFWPEKLSASAKSPISLEIEIVNLPGGRPQKSIVWSVDKEPIEAAKDKFVLILDITQNREYEITVTVTDFLGGTDVIQHTLVKTNDNLPNVDFLLNGIHQGFGTKYLIYPNTIFTISTKLIYPEGTTSDDYKFQWTRNGVQVPGKFIYRSTADETTIEMCDEKVVYTIKVSTTDELKSIEYTLNVWVFCRNPIAKISGNDLRNVDVRSDDVTLYGYSSRDPDGGTLTYEWTCSTLENSQCINDVTKSETTTASLITISPSKMKTGKKYAIFLTVRVKKTGKFYNETDRVEFAVQAGNRPVIRWVTMRTKFRHDVPIMMRAYVGHDVKVKWKFRDDLSLYEYIDSKNRSIGKSRLTDDGFAWYRIQEGVLKPGKKYKLHINVTKTESGLSSTDERDINVYALLRGCSVETNAITEFEEATILLRNCAQDPDVTWKSIMCTEGDRELHISKEHTFIVPRFKSDVQKIVLKCKIMDNLGNSMIAEPKEVVVRKTTQETTMDKMIEGLKQNGDKVKALALISEMVDEDEYREDESLNTKAVELIKEIIDGSPSDDDINFSLKSYGKLNVDKLKGDDKKPLADALVSMLDKLCHADQTDATTFDAEQTKHILRNIKRLMASNPKTLGKLYRQAEEKFACVKFKQMKNEDSEIIRDEDGTKHAYLVTVLEDIPEELGFEFPEELKERYRDQWNCKEAESCFGVGVIMEEYPSEPPDLLRYKRADDGCRKHVILKLYNPSTGEGIDINNLEGTINMNLGSKCKRGKCWYRDELLQRYSQDGVTTIVRDNGDIICQSNHLTAFTAESEPEPFKGLNVPYVISLCVGGILLLASLVILVKLWLVTKHRANAVEDEKEFALDDVPMNKDNSPSFKKR